MVRREMREASWWKPAKGATDRKEDPHSHWHRHSPGQSFSVSKQELWWISESWTVYTDQASSPRGMSCSLKSVYTPDKSFFLFPERDTSCLNSFVHSIVCFSLNPFRFNSVLKLRQRREGRTDLQGSHLIQANMQKKRHPISARASSWLQLAMLADVSKSKTVERGNSKSNAHKGKIKVEKVKSHVTNHHGKIRKSQRFSEVRNAIDIQETTSCNWKDRDQVTETIKATKPTTVSNWQIVLCLEKKKENRCNPKATLQEAGATKTKLRKG